MKSDPCIPKRPPPWTIKKRWSLQKCLVLLGASNREVYMSNEKTGHTWVVKPNQINGYRTIHQRFSSDELLEWIEMLWKQAARWHPDIHPKCKYYYTKKFQYASEAYFKAKHILKYHGAKA